MKVRCSQIKRIRYTVILFAVLLLFSGCHSPGSSSDNIVLPGEDPFVPLSAEMQQQISQAWLSETGNPLNLDSENPDSPRYYGTFGDSVVIFQGGPLTVLSSQTIAGYEFRHPSSFEIFVYHGGTFCTLKEAYSKRLLTQHEIGIISKYHKSRLSVY